MKNAKACLNLYRITLALIMVFFVNDVKSQNYNFTGGVQTYVVPPCVTSINIVAAGAKGGGAAGGAGARVTGTLSVTPGQVLEIRVGGNGTCPGAGYNGGGIGKPANTAANASCGGGGATDIRVAPYALGNRVLVAAGGGGIGGGTSDGAGGAGGCQNGVTGTSPFGAGGGGATQFSGGTAGPPWIASGNAGLAGTLAIGGAGGTDPCYNVAPGGGGGGGRYGGGGGGSDCFASAPYGGGGGGGGSSLIPTGGGCLQGNNNSANGGYVTITPIIGNITITANPVAPLICQGATAQLTASGGLTYTWSPAVDSSNANGDTVSVSPAVPTVYTVTGTDVNGCTGTATVNVGFLPTPTLTTVSTPSAICLGDTAVVTVTGASNCSWTGNYLYANATNDSIWVSPAATDNYTVTATGANGCVGTAVATVNVNPLPTAVAGADENICTGATVTLNASGGLSYSWTPSTGLSATNVFDPTVTVNNTQTYTLTVTDANGCTDTDDITVNAVPLPIANPGSNVSICPGASTTLNGSGGTSYTWSPATGLNDPNIANPVCTPAATTSYTLIVANANCTSLPSAPITVTVYNQPAAPLINVNGPITFCQGNSVTLTSTAPSNNFWSTGATSNSITITTSGTYTVYYVDANGCSSTVSAPVNVVVNPLPAIPTIAASGPLTVCPGGSVDLTSTPANTYMWSTGANTQTITVTTSGNYSLTIADVNGCTATSANTLFTLLPTPAVPIITPDGPLSFCTGDSVILTSSPAANYLWNNGATAQSITVYASGTFSVTNTTADGCITPTSAAINTVMFPVPPAPIINANGPLTFCYGNNVVLTSSAASAYTWSNTFTTQSITVTTSGIYNVSIIDANGCPSPPSADVIVVVNQLPQSPIITAAGPTTVCAGSSVTLQSNQPSGNLWSTGSTANSITVNTSGNYSVSYTDANNCTSLVSNPVMVTIQALAPTPTISASGPTTFCENDSVVLTCSQAQTYLWNNGATTPSITVYSSGTYSVSVTDVCNPIDPDTDIQITVNPSPTADFNAPVLFDCLPSTMLFVNNSSSAAAYLWDFGNGGNSNETNPAYIYQFPGVYDISLTVFDVNGCSNTKTINDYIQIFPAAEVSYSISPRVTTLLNSAVEFKNTTPNCLTQTWDLGAVGNFTDVKFTHNFESVGVYPVMLTVATENGCVETVTDSVIIEENYVIYIPNSFTPNGDGLNDSFIAIGGGIKDFKMEIYNRWGNLIYTTSSLDKPWDGVGHGQDNYLWKVYLKDSKGTDREMIGSVTLLR
jgi:gliding motility-associated-like protein